jgi:hypothetical protein
MTIASSKAVTIAPWIAERIPAEAYDDPDLSIGRDSKFWIIEKSGFEEVLALVERTSAPDRAEAHANLIATAPDLLAFVRKLHAETNCICGIQSKLKGTSLETDLECTKCAAAKLIAKAEGRP